MGYKIKISKKMLIIGGIIIILLVGFIILVKQKKEHADFSSKCGFTGQQLLVEQCLTNSAGKSMDDFIKCMKDNGIENKIITNFSPLDYALLVGDIKCNELENAMNTAKNS